MKLFQPKFTPIPLGPLLREAREARKESLEEASLVARLSVAEIEALVNAQPLAPTRARIQAVSYLRSLGLNPSAFHESLPPVPELLSRSHRVVSRGDNPFLQGCESLLAMLAPMGKLALTLLFLVALLGSWGMVRQLSRVRSLPWVTYSYTVPANSSR